MDYGSAEWNVTIESLDEWVHFTHVHPGYGPTLYVNGQYVARSLFALRTVDNQTLRIGITGAACFDGLIDDVRLYDRAVDEEEIVSIMRGSPAQAGDPHPAYGSMPTRDLAYYLAWSAGPDAIEHDVYFGADRTAVTEADPTTADIYRGRQSCESTRYALPEAPLEWGKTYYWRVDEIDVEGTVTQGSLWRFTVADDLVGWWKCDEGQGDRVVDSSGHDHHAILMGDPQWVPGYEDLALDFDGQGDYIETGKLPSDLGMGGNAPRTVALWAYTRRFNGGGLYEMGGDGQYEGFALRTEASDNTWRLEHGDEGKAFSIHSTNEWVHFAHVNEGDDPLLCNDPLLYVNGERVVRTWNGLDTVDDKTFRIGVAGQTHFDGLIDDIRLYSRAVAPDEILRIMQGGPARAWAPQLAHGSTPTLDDTGALSWSAGAGALEHDIYFGFDQTAVRNATTETDGVYRGRLSLGATTYVLPEAPLEWSRTYYWRVDEIGADRTITRGALWRFTTCDYLIIDDFERYDDEETRIYETWIDGWGTDNGSIVGYFEAPFAPGPIIAHTGRQSMPFMYDNTEFAWHSEAYRLWDEPRDWTRFGVDTLTLHLVGIPIPFLERDDGSLLMGGEGLYRWETEDDFRFASKQLHGDGSIVVRVDGLANTGPWDRAGVMIRESFADDGRHVAVLVTTGHGVSFQYRSIDEGKAERRTCESPQTPYWVKLERSGDTFTAWRSLDGVRWVPATGDLSDSSVSIPMSSDVYVGLAVSSDSWHPATIAEFSGVSIAGDATGAWEVAGIGQQSPGNEPETLYVGLSDEAGNLKVVTHPNPLVVGAALWERWDIPLSEFATAGVDVTRITKIILGLGDRDNPTPGGAGMMHFDDFRLTRSDAPPPDETP